MKESTINAFSKLSEITGKKCQTCPGGDEFRCCDKMFCDAAQIPLGISVDRPSINGIPYMGKTGCVLPAHYRPMCAGYVCGGHFKDRSFRREYDRIVDKINKDPSQSFPCSDQLSSIAGSFNPEWWGHNRKFKKP